ncbi:MAG TPA: site-2 protease family protein [Thermoanaerobaculia bacterium]|nr:site-2 protease family protein [Thermoanaerobaculia bacterium]
MFGRPIEIVALFGIRIRIDPSWFIVAVLVTWNFAALVFPAQLPGRAPATYWSMGVAGALGFFLSVLLHELSHAVVARTYGVHVRAITLFIFGGLAEMPVEPPTPQAELVIAAAGPAASFGLALACGGLTLVGSIAGWPAAVISVLGYLGILNGTLGLFNLVPALPLDGGRILRAVLWGWRRDLRWATRVASATGSGFGLLLIGLGVVSLVSGNFSSGLWLFLIGLFLRNAASASYQQLLLRRTLEGEPVSRFMHADPVTVPRAISVLELVQSYIYRYHFKMFPVVDDSGRLLGCVTARRVRELPRDEWDRQTVGALAERCSPENTVRADTDALEALTRMSRSGASRLMVVDDDRLLGILSLKDLLHFFSLKMELEEPGRG